MKFAIFTSALAVFSGLASSAAVPIAEESGLEARQSTTIFPSLVVEISSPDSGWVSDSVYISRYTWEGKQYDTNALLAYDFTAAYSGRKCTFSFSGGWYAGGTRKVQLFTVGDSNTVIKADNTFTSRPFRNNFLGIFTISEDGSIGIFDDIPAPSFDCPKSATTLGFEVIPQGDEDWAGWPKNGGLGIVVS